MSKNKFCPNLSHPNAKALIEKVGLLEFYKEYIKNDYNIPSKEYIESIAKPENVQYQLPQGREIEEFVASEKTIRDLAARMSDRIGIPVRFESDRSKQYKGKLEDGTAVVNLAYATLDTPIHEILGHPIIRAIKNRSNNYKEGETAEFHGYGEPERVTITKIFNDTLEVEFKDSRGNTQKADLFELTKTQNTLLYQNLLKELEYGKGKEVLDRIKRDYVYKEGKSRSHIVTQEDHDAGKFLDSEVGSGIGIAELYTLEEQQEEAIVELLGLYTAERLDKVKDGKLISLLKRLLKEMKAFMKQLLGQKEVEINKLPDNMTLGDIADLLAYSNSKLILPGNEVVYTTPDNQQFKTYQEASNHISELAKNVEDVDLDNIILSDVDLNGVDLSKIDYFEHSHEDIFEGGINNGKFRKENNKWFVEWNDDGIQHEIEEKYVLNNYSEKLGIGLIRNFIEKNKEYEQSKEIIEEWKKVNNIQYNPEEVYSRGQEFVSVVGAYSDFDVDLMMQNLLQHIEDNQKAGGEFTISAFTKPIDRKIGHLEGGGGKIKFKIYPQSQDIKWAANTDVYSGSVWDASEKVSKDKKSELLGVSYTKYPSLNNINSVQPNLAAIIDNLAHHHNELGISLTGNNFRLEYDENIPYQTKKIIDSINSILDQKYGKLVKPEIKKQIKNLTYTALGEYNQEKRNSVVKEFKTKEEAVKWIEQNKEQYEATTGSELVLGEFWDEGIQPTQTNETLKESIDSVSNRTAREIIGKEYAIRVTRPSGGIEISIYYDNKEDALNRLEEDASNYKDSKVELIEVPKYGKIKEKEYTEQALTNTKVAKLKEVAKKYPRSLIRSEVRPISNSPTISNLGFTEDELPFQKISKSHEDISTTPEGSSVEDILFVNKDLFTADQQNAIVESMVKQIVDYRDGGETNVNSLKESLREDYQLMQEFFGDPESPSYNSQLGEHYQNILDNYDELFARSELKLEQFGIKVVGDRTDINSEYEDAEYDFEAANYYKLNYSDEASFIQSSKDTASSHLKIALSTLPQYVYENGEIVTETNPDGTVSNLQKLNFLGLPRFEDLDTTWNSLLYELLDVPIGEKLNHLANSSNPKHRAIYQHIIENPNTQIQNEFEVTFSKQQAKFTTVVIKRGDSNGLRTIFVMDTNRNNPSNLLMQDWYSNFMGSELLSENEYGDLYVDTDKGKELKEEFESILQDYDKDIKEGNKKIKDLLSKIGINVTIKALTEGEVKIPEGKLSGRGIIKSRLRFIFDRLAGLSNEDTSNLENKLEANNPFISEHSTLNMLAKIENDVNPTLFESSFISGDGKAKYSFVNNSFMSERIRELKNEDFLRRKLSVDFNSGSTWAKKLLGPNRDLYLREFDVHYMDTTGNDASNQDNKPYSRMNNREREFTKVSLFQNSGRDSAFYMGLVPSDKTTLPLIKFRRQQVIRGENGLYDSSTMNDMVSLFMSEYSRVKQTIKQNSDPNIKKIDKYHTTGSNKGLGSSFIIFPMFNDILFEDGSLMELDDNAIRDIIKPELVKFMDSLVEDTKKYWTKLNLYNKVIFDKSFANKRNYDLNEGIDSSVEKLAVDYSINTFMALVNQIQLFSGDPALHGKLTEQDKKKGLITNEGSILQTWENYFKRMAKDIAPGLDPNFKEDDTVNYLFLDDIEYASDHMMEYMEKISGDIGQAYARINPADAQEYTTLEEHLKVMDALGRLTDEHKEAAKRLMDGGEDINDIKLILQPMKPVYVNTVIEDGIEKVYYIKTSSFPLIPAITKGLEIDKLRVAMEGNKSPSGEPNPIGRAVYASGVKLGLNQNIPSISKDGTVFNELTLEESHVTTLPRKGFRIQQELPYHGTSGNINQASQGRKLITSGVVDDGDYIYNGKSFKGKTIKEKFENLHIEKMNRAADALLEDLGAEKIDIGDGETTYRLTNLSKIADILKDEAISRNYPVNDVYSIQVIEDNGVQRFKVPLGFTNNSSRLEAILNSLVTNRVIKSSLPGMQLVQASNAGFISVAPDTDIRRYHNQITWVDPTDTKLNYITEKDGSLVSADILLPSYFGGINLKDYVKEDGTLDTKRIPESLLTVIGYRIPTQGHNSMMKFRVKGFLPSVMGEITVVPGEITAQMGSDFDVDKLFIYRYHYTEEGGKLKKILPNHFNIKEMTDEEIDNMIIQMFEDRLSDPRNFASMMEPNGFGKLPETAKFIAKHSKEEKHAHILSSRAQNDIFSTNADGKMGVAIFSLYSTFFKAIQDAGISLITPQLHTTEVNGKTTELPPLYENLNYEGGTKSNTLMFLQSASVDNAKEQLLGLNNINDITMGVAGAMAYLGYPEDHIGLFLNQPIIKEYVESVANNGDIIDGQVDYDIHENTIHSLISTVAPNYKNLGPIERLELYKSIKYSKNTLSDVIEGKFETSAEAVTNLTPAQLELINNSNNALQLKVLLEYNNFHNYARELEFAMKVLSVDTKGLGTNLISVETSHRNLNKLLRNIVEANYSFINMENLFNNTVIGEATRILSQFRNLYGQLFPYASKTYDEVIESIVEGVGLSQSEKNIGHITAELKSFFLATEEILGENVDELRERLLFNDSTNIAGRWAKYSNTDRGKLNPLTKRIKISKRTNTKTDPYGLESLNTPASNNTVDINNSIMYFYNMINSDDIAERELAEDLVKYYLISGGQFGPRSIGKYITYDILEKYGYSSKLRAIEDGIKNNNIGLEGFLDQYFMNNPFKAKSVDVDLSNVNSVKGNLPNFLLDDGELSKYIVYYDQLNSTPHLFKLNTDGNNARYDRLNINPSFKTSKHYNYDNQAVSGSSPLTRPVGPQLAFKSNTAEGTSTENSPSNLLNKFINEDFSVNSIIDTIADSSKSNNNKYLADKLRKLHSLDLIHVDTVNTNGLSNGYYDSNDNTIYMDTFVLSRYKDPVGKFEEVFLHELLHGITVRILQANEDSLTPEQLSAKKRITALFNAYVRKFEDQEGLNRFIELLNKRKTTKLTEAEKKFLFANKSTMYPLTDIYEFIAAGLTDPSFSNQLKENNLWQKLLNFIADIIGINVNDFEFLFNSTIELSGLEVDQSNLGTGSTTFEDINTFNLEEANRQEFVSQRNEFFSKYKVKDYFKGGLSKKYRPETQRRFLEANNNPKYNRLKIWFWNNELRVSHVDPLTKTYRKQVFEDIAEEDTKSPEEQLVDRVLNKFRESLKIRRDRYRAQGDKKDPRLLTQIKGLEERIKDLENDKSLAHLISVTSARLGYIEKALDEGTLKDGQDIADALAHIREFKIINSQLEIDTSDNMGKTIADGLNKVSGKASELYGRVLQTGSAVVDQYKNERLGDINVNVSDALTKGVLDANIIESNLLDFSRSSSPHIQAIGYLISEGQFRANNRYNDKLNEFNTILEEYVSKYGNTFTQLMQLGSDGNPTGYLLSAFKEDFYKKASKNVDFWGRNINVKYSLKNQKLFQEEDSLAKEALSEEEYLNWKRINDPMIWINRWEKGRYDRYSPAVRFLDITPKEEWVDSRYSDLMKLGENDPAVKLYHYVNDLLTPINRKYKNQTNYLPGIRKEWTEQMLQGNVKGVFTNVINDRDVDEIYNTELEMDDITGEPRNYIRGHHMFRSDLSSKDKSYDLGLIIPRVLHSEESLKVKHEMEPLLNIYYIILKESKSIVKYKGQELVGTKEASNTTSHAKYLIDSWLYNQSRSRNEAESKYGKATDILNSYLRVKGMGWNPFSGFGNVMQSLMSNFTFAAGNQYFSMNDYSKALNLSLHTIAGSSDVRKKIKNAYIWTDAFVLNNELNFSKDRRVKDATKSKIAKAAEPMALTQAVEYFNQAQTMIAVLMGEKVKDVNGKERSLWEAFDNDFNWKTEEFGDNPYDDRARFRLQMKIQKAVADVHGNYGREIQAKKHFWARALLAFRTWLPQAIANRFGEYRKDVLLGIETKGRYRSLYNKNTFSFLTNEEGKIDFEELKNNLIWLIGLSKKTNLNDVDQMAMKKNLAELSILTGLMIAMLALRSVIDEDDDDKWYYTYLLNNLIRAESDLTMFMGPYAWQKVIRDPIPLTSVVRDLYDLIPASMDFIMGDDKYKAGFRKGQSKLLKHSLDNIPGVRQIQQQWSFAKNEFIDF